MDLRARGADQFSDAADVDLCRVVVDAQLRRAGVARDVRAGDAGPSRQRGDQSADAAVVGVRSSSSGRSSAAGSLVRSLALSFVVMLQSRLVKACYRRTITAPVTGDNIFEAIADGTLN